MRYEVADLILGNRQEVLYERDAARRIGGVRCHAKDAEFFDGKGA